MSRPHFFHKSSLEVSFAVEAMVSASMASFIVEGETDSARGREGLEGTDSARGS